MEKDGRGEKRGGRGRGRARKRCSEWARGERGNWREGRLNMGEREILDCTERGREREENEGGKGRMGERLGKETNSKREKMKRKRKRKIKEKIY